MDQGSSLKRAVKRRANRLSVKKRGIRIREPIRNPFPRIFSVTSGKGGVGKTSIVGNLAVAFSMAGKRVLILDADLGLANIDIILGINPKYNIKHVIYGEKDLSDVIVEGPAGVCVIPASSGIQELVHLTEGQKLNLLNEFDKLNDLFDVLLIDTAAGISSNVMYFNLAADERIVVATTEPTSIIDAYALIKVMFMKYGTKHFKVLINMVDCEEEAEAVYRNLTRVVFRSLKGSSVEYIGFIAKDDHLQMAVRRRRSVIELYPDSRSCKSFRDLANNLLTLPVRDQLDGNIKFFWRRLINCP
nr:MinD/ParA family protein [Desulfobacterales bacterium]